MSSSVWIAGNDCFSMSEYMAIDHFGITGPGESWKAVENGDLERDGAIPVNPSGGLIGVGHPVGASGVRMLRDAARQVTSARTFATLNIGGSLTTTVSFVVTGEG
jgi:acetyl-CoA C-acetyltransferase